VHSEDSIAERETEQRQRKERTADNCRTKKRKTQLTTNLEGRIITADGAELYKVLTSLKWETERREKEKNTERLNE
jgi:hypothetical protein